MPGHVFLAGERVELRPVECDDDVELLGRVRNDPAFRRHLGFETPWPRSRVEEFVERVTEDDSSVNLLVCLPGDGAEDAADREGASAARPIGAVNLFDVDRTSGTLAYWLREAYRGEGYATEAVSLVLAYAFDELGLHRVAAVAHAENEASRRLLERLGFVHEGTDREARFARGEHRDDERYAVLEGEWRAGETSGEVATRER